MEQQRQHQTWPHQILQPNRVNRGIMRRPKFDLHQIQHIDTASDEEDLHQEPIETVLMEEIEIAGDKDDSVEELRFEGDATTRF